jgi:hypothetical protein
MPATSGTTAAQLYVRQGNGIQTDRQKNRKGLVLQLGSFRRGSKVDARYRHLQAHCIGLRECHNRSVSKPSLHLHFFAALRASKACVAMSAFRDRVSLNEHSKTCRKRTITHRLPARCRHPRQTAFPPAVHSRGPSDRPAALAFRPWRPTLRLSATWMRAGRLPSRARR